MPSPDAADGARYRLKQCGEKGLHATLSGRLCGSPSPLPSAVMDDDRSRTLQSEATRLADAARDRAAGTFEDVKVASSQIVDKVRDLIEEGNVRRISLRKGERVLFEIPLTVGVGAGAAALLTSPLLAAVGAVAALVSDITVAVERDDDAAADPEVATPSDDASKTSGGDAGTSGASSENAGTATESGNGDQGAGKTVGKPASGTSEGNGGANA